MNSLFSFIKATVIGGIFFLVPIGMLVLLVGKIVPFLIKFEEKLGVVVDVERPAGMVVLNICAILVILLLCFLAGLAAASGPGKKVVEMLEESVLGAMPGYTFIKGFTSSMRDSDEVAEGFTPVLVRLDDYSQTAFEIERIEATDKVVVYLPGAPNPWSGTVAYVDAERVEALDQTVPQVVRNIKQLGKGSGDARDSVLSGG